MPSWLFLRNWAQSRLGQGAFVGPAKQTALNMIVLIHPFDPPFSTIILERKKCNTNITQALKHLGKHLQTTKVFGFHVKMPFWGSFWGMPPRLPSVRFKRKRSSICFGLIAGVMITTPNSRDCTCQMTVKLGDIEAVTFL